MTPIDGNRARLDRVHLWTGRDAPLPQTPKRPFPSDATLVSGRRDTAAYGPPAAADAAFALGPESCEMAKRSGVKQHHPWLGQPYEAVFAPSFWMNYQLRFPPPTRFCAVTVVTIPHGTIPQMEPHSSHRRKQLLYSRPPDSIFLSGHPMEDCTICASRCSACKETAISWRLLNATEASAEVGFRASRHFLAACSVQGVVRRWTWNRDRTRCMWGHDSDTRQRPLGRRGNLGAPFAI